MRRWSFGTGGWTIEKPKSKWVEGVSELPLTNDRDALPLDSLFLPAENAGKQERGALIGADVPESEHPQWLFYLGRTAEAFGRVRDAYHVTGLLITMKCELRLPITLAELRLFGAFNCSWTLPKTNLPATIQ